MAWQPMIITCHMFCFVMFFFLFVSFCFVLFNFLFFHWFYLSLPYFPLLSLGRPPQIITVGIGEADEDELKAVASPPLEDNVHMVKGMQNLKDPQAPEDVRAGIKGRKSLPAGLCPLWSYKIVLHQISARDQLCKVVCCSAGWRAFRLSRLEPVLDLINQGKYPTDLGLHL